RVFAVAIAALVNIPSLFLVQRDSPDEFLNKGLSISNVLAIIGTLLMIAACAYLLVVVRRLKYDIFAGASFWVILLFVIYLVSAVWSIYPDGSAFRAIELLAFYIVAIFIFTGQRPLLCLYWLMFFQVMFSAIPLLSTGFGYLQAGWIVGIMSSNQHSFYAA